MSASSDLKERVSPASISDRVQVDGKFFRVGARKFHPKGVTYGPFKPGPGGSPFPDRERASRDFDLIGGMNANCLRVYFVPPDWFLDLAYSRGLRILIDYNWSKHTCFLDDRSTARQAREITRAVARQFAGHPGVFALTLANEIPNDVARWYGTRRVEGFLDELAEIVKTEDPHRLVTFANFPSTEFLNPDDVDFVSFNVYLHDGRAFRNYLTRLQNIANEKPLVLTEFGMDAMKEGAETQAEFLSGHVETAFRAGVAGTFLFAFTDDWFTGGHQIDNWFFGLTDRERSPRPSYRQVAEKFAIAPYFPLPQYPKVSVVVASYNGGSTLPACLDSLSHVNYPDCEVILVDDGSTDDTARIAAHYPRIRCITHSENRGLSAARNTGIRAAQGEIVAFTDSDCRVDEDWLLYLVGDLMKSSASAIGGHNFPPPDSDWVATCVAVAPGGPAHVMLDDVTAEHIPGCNMAFWKGDIEAIDGFDPVFRAAGDDVDVCWRLLQSGCQIGFSHAGFVWHYRRSTVQAYLNQQAGYGRAEAQLRHKHPEYFNSLGGMRWHGRIYGPARMADLFGRSVIYHGPFGSGLFQSMYTPEPVGLIPFLTSLEWHVVVTFGMLLLTALWTALWPLAALSLLASITVAVTAACRVRLLPRQSRWCSRPLVALLYLLQPIVRGWPRYSRRLITSPTPALARSAVRDIATGYQSMGTRRAVTYWTDKGVERMTFLEHLLALLERDRWPTRVDSGWDDYDVCIYMDRASRVRIKTVAENHGGTSRRLRVRLSAGWTLLSKVYFALLMAVALALRNIYADYQWAPAFLLTIPLFAWYLEHRAIRTLRLGVALMDYTARELGLTKLDKPNASEAPCTPTGV